MEVLTVQVESDQPNNGGGDRKISVRDLVSESDKGVEILRYLTLDIPRGVIVGIIGPSGSSKLTFLRALNRLWEPPTSTVFLDSQDICGLDVLSLRRKVGMLFQLPALFEEGLYTPKSLDT